MKQVLIEKTKRWKNSKRNREREALNQYYTDPPRLETQTWSTSKKKNQRTLKFKYRQSSLNLTNVGEKEIYNT